MNYFFKKAIKSIKTTGSISPSSSHLIHTCLKKIDFSTVDFILEFGAGNGCFTEAITHQMKKGSTLISFEINDDFYTLCKKKFIQNKQVHVIHASAIDFKQHIPSAYISKKPQLILSSLPLSLFEKNITRQLLTDIKNTLSQEGTFVQYQYSTYRIKMLKEIFDHIDYSFTLKNIPPSIVYHCYK